MALYHSRPLPLEKLVLHPLLHTHIQNLFLFQITIPTDKKKRRRYRVKKNERTKMDWWKRLSVIKFVSRYTCPILGRLQSLQGFGSDIYEQQPRAVQYSVRRTVFSICKLFRPRACIVYTFSVRRLRRKSQSLGASERKNESSTEKRVYYIFLGNGRTFRFQKFSSEH